MPIYEYTCSVCGTRFDALRSMRDSDSPIQCKVCQSSDTHRAVSKFFSHSEGPVLEGTGSSCSGSCSHCSRSSCGCGNH